MTEYVKKTFEHAWQAAKFVQEGGKLFFEDAGSGFVEVSERTAYELFDNGAKPYIIKPTDWRERLDGTVGNAVLCWVWDGDVEANVIELIAELGEQCFLCHRGIPWGNAKPITRAEILALANNAPEE